MSLTKKISSLLLFMGIAAILLLYPDETLNHETQTALNSIDWKTQNDAYLYVLGIDAALDTDPKDEGKKVLKSIRQKEATYSQPGSYEYIDTLESIAKLEVPDLDFFCSLDDKGCFEKIVSFNSVDLDKEPLLTIKNRYLTLLTLNDYRSLTQPHFLEPFPNYDFLIKGNRLANIEAIYLAQKCCPEKAVQNLYGLIEQQRKQMVLTDNLLGRMIDYVLINESIEVLSRILRQHELDGKQLAPLSVTELSLETALKREQALSISTLQLVGEHYNIDWLPDWALKIFFKKNITINAVAPIFKQAISVSERPQPEFENALASYKSIALKESWLKNPLGTIRNRMYPIYFDTYIARGLDLNAKISLFNGALGQPITAESLSRIPNPYYANSFDAKISKETNTACFGGPLVDDKNRRCLYLIPRVAN